jgi:hypothetical protein
MHRVEGIPQSVAIGGRTFQVDCTKRRPPWVKLDPGEKDADIGGGISFELQRIWLRNTGVIDKMQDNLMHEVGHGLLDLVYDSSEKVKFAVDGNKDLDEALTDGLGKALLSFLRDNDHAWARATARTVPE